MKTRCSVTVLSAAAFTVLLAGGCASGTKAPDTAGLEGAGDGRRAVIVVTNVTDVPGTETPTGYWLSEVSHPWQVFTEAGYEVVIASPDGGRVEYDPRSNTDDDINGEFMDTQAFASMMDTPEIEALSPSDFEIVLFAGGHGTMWDFPAAFDAKDFMLDAYRSGAVVGAVCHGPAIFLNMAKPDDTEAFFVDGRRLTAFTDEEEATTPYADTVPFMLEDQLRYGGAEFTESAPGTSHVVTDGRLVTGQNPASATATAVAMVRAAMANRPQMNDQMNGQMSDSQMDGQMDNQQTAAAGDTSGAIRITGGNAGAGDRSTEPAPQPAPTPAPTPAAEPATAPAPAPAPAADAPTPPEESGKGVWRRWTAG